jgi:hypothetical protein
MLADELRSFERSNQLESQRVIFENSPRVRPQRGARIDVDHMGLVGLLNVMDRWCNIIALSTAIIRYLDSGSFTAPSLRPRSPVAGESGNLEEQHPTFEEIEAFIQM